jgi:uncharacterized protein YbgA (DUF1722 family)/uncharacterized protein YbbK (DUF523 family)
MTPAPADRIRLGVSSCLLGEAVRYDGGHTRDRFLTDALGPYVEWVPTCPEADLGLGVPRDTLRLVGSPAAPRLVQEKTGEDLTARMQAYARERVRALAARGLDGYVLKRASPSCGLFRVRVYRDGVRPGADGRGLFATALVGALPTLPVEEEGRLADPALREHFIERVFVAARWRGFMAGHPRPRDLVAFHAAIKLAVLAHSPAHYARLGRIAATAGRGALRATLAEYHVALMEGFAVRATRGRHANVLQHAAGHVGRALAPDERAELAEVIEEYRRGLVPLVVPITLVAHHARRQSIAYLTGQVYLRPHPKELMLRNHV